MAALARPLLAAALAAAAAGLNLTSVRLTAADADAQLARGWRAANRNAAPHLGTESWIPSAEQTGRTEQAPAEPSSRPLAARAHSSRPSAQDAWLRVANAAADEAAATSMMVSAWLKMTWRTVNTPNEKGVTALMAVASHGHTDVRP